MRFDKLSNISFLLGCCTFKALLLRKENKESYLKLTTFYLYIKISQQTYF